MSKKDDSVFQVSLTEIAFTLVLLMLLLLGHRLVVTLQEISQQKSLIDQQREQIQKYEYIQNNLQKFGGMCTPDPEDPIDTMMPCVKCLSVAGRLTKEDSAKSIDLGKNMVEQWKAQGEKINFDDYQQKLAEAAVKIAQGKEVLLGEEIQKLVAEAKAATMEREQLIASNEKLTAQNAYFQRRAGMDDPPCWLSDKAFRPQYLFAVTILPDQSYVVAPNWPREREEEAYTIPGVKEMVQKKHLSRAEFNRYSTMIMEHSQQRKPQACRHFVTMTSQVLNRVEGDKARLNLEQFFYKFEIVR